MNNEYSTNSNNDDHWNHDKNLGGAYFSYQELYDKLSALLLLNHPLNSPKQNNSLAPNTNIIPKENTTDSHIVINPSRNILLNHVIKTNLIDITNNYIKNKNKTHQVMHNNPNPKPKLNPFHPPNEDNKKKTQIINLSIKPKQTNNIKTNTNVSKQLKNIVKQNDQVIRNKMMIANDKKSKSPIGGCSTEKRIIIKTRIANSMSHPVTRKINENFAKIGFKQPNSRSHPPMNRQAQKGKEFCCSNITLLNKNNIINLTSTRKTNSTSKPKKPQSLNISVKFKGAGQQQQQHNTKSNHDHDIDIVLKQMNEPKSLSRQNMSRNPKKTKAGINDQSPSIKIEKMFDFLTYNNKPSSKSKSKHKDTSLSKGKNKPQVHSLEKKKNKLNIRYEMLGDKNKNAHQGQGKAKERVNDDNILSNSTMINHKDYSQTKVEIQTNYNINPYYTNNTHNNLNNDLLSKAHPHYSNNNSKKNTKQTTSTSSSILPSRNKSKNHKLIDPNAKPDHTPTNANSHTRNSLKEKSIATSMNITQHQQPPYSSYLTSIGILKKKMLQKGKITTDVHCQPISATYQTRYETKGNTNNNTNSHTNTNNSIGKISLTLKSTKINKRSIGRNDKYCDGIHKGKSVMGKVTEVKTKGVTGDSSNMKKTGDIHDKGFNALVGLRKNDFKMKMISTITMKALLK